VPLSSYFLSSKPPVLANEMMQKLIGERLQVTGHCIKIYAAALFLCSISNEKDDIIEELHTSKVCYLLIYIGGGKGGFFNCNTCTHRERPPLLAFSL